MALATPGCEGLRLPTCQKIICWYPLLKVEPPLAWPTASLVSSISRNAYVRSENDKAVKLKLKNARSSEYVKVAPLFVLNKLLYFKVDA